MTVRSYRAETVESAIRQARLDLGEEAMLLDSRKLEPQERLGGPGGLYEVRFGVSGAPAPGGAAAAGLASAPEARLDELTRHVGEIRRLLYTLTHQQYLPAAGRGGHPELGELYSELADAEVAPQMAAEIMAALAPLAERAAARAELEQALAGEVGARIETSDEIGRPGTGPRVLALVGPPGSGKTTTLVKLAVEYGLGRKRPVRLLTADTYRVGAAPQLEAYASILGVEARAAEDVGELERALDQMQAGAPDLVLIDTPGHGWQELDEYGGELAALLGSREEVDTHLVLNASTRGRDLERLIERYREFGPRKLLFTHLDETVGPGALVSEAWRAQLPLSFFGTGQRIPEDLRPATREAVADLILNRRRKAAGR